MVPVPDHRSAHPFHMLLFPSRIHSRPDIVLHIKPVIHIGLPPQKAVALDIGFQNYIKSQFIAHIHKPRGWGIVGGPDTVDVQLLHQQEILVQLFIGLMPAVVRIGVVMIYPMELHRRAVDEQLMLG